LDQRLVELCSKYGLWHSAIALAEQKSKSKNEVIHCVLIVGLSIREECGVSSFFTAKFCTLVLSFTVDVSSKRVVFQLSTGIVRLLLSM